MVPDKENASQPLFRVILRSGFGSLVLGIVGKLLAIGTAVLLARLLGPDGYGVYAFVIATVTLLAIPVQLGLPNLVIRLVAVYEQNAQWALLKGLFRWGNYWVLGLSLVVFMLGAIVLSTFAMLPEAVPPLTMLSGLGMLPLLGLAALRGAALRGLRHVVIGQIPESLVQPLLLQLLVLLAAGIWGFTVVDATLTVQLTVIAVAAGFLVGAVLLAKALPPELRGLRPHCRSREWAVTAVPYFLAFGAHLILRNTDLVMLGFMTTPEDTGIYRVASQAALLTAFFVSIVHPVVGPYITRFHQARNEEGLQQIVTLGSWIAVLGALPLLVIYIFAGETVLTFFFGAVYVHGYSALVLLSLAHFVYALMAPVGPLLGMTGYAWHATAAILCAAVLNVGLNFVLIPMLGLEGAAWATLLSVIVMHGLMAVFAYRCTGTIVPKLWPMRISALTMHNSWRAGW